MAGMDVVILIMGMVLLAVGGQGAIRLLLDNSGAGQFAWVPGGFVGQLIASVAVAIFGLALAGWGSGRARKRGQLS